MANETPADLATKAKRVKVDNQEVERHSLKDQLDALDRQAARDQAAKANFGIVRRRFKHGTSE